MSDTKSNANGTFQPFIPGTTLLPEFTVKSILLGAMFGVIFGASTVYLALKAGLTVSASIPIAVLAISIGRKLFHTSILENNIVQTTGSAGESVAAGVVFTLPGFLFLSAGSNGPAFFNYWTIFSLAMFGGILGTLMMIPLRRSLIVQEHGKLPYPEGTACASVLIAGEKGGDFSKTAYQGLGFAFIYAFFQKVIHLISEAPEWATSQANKYFPSAVVSGEITPEYLGVGYIIGPRIAGVLVAGGVLAWLCLIPLLSSLVPSDVIAAQLVKLGELGGLDIPGGPGGWDPAAHAFADTASAVYKAYVRQIGAGAVAAGGFITLLKTLPTIISSFKGSIASLKNRQKESENSSRTERDLSFLTVIIGSLALVLVITLLPIIPGNGFLSKLLLAVLVIIFGFFFVTVSSRIVGIIGSSSNPVSGMTIATIMGTSLVFIAARWTGMVYEPMVLVVGGIICIAAANAGATSQDLKTGYLIGATPKYQQLALFIGAVVSAAVIGWTIHILDTPTAEMAAQGIAHAIGSDKFPAPQGTLMATLIKGLLSFNLDWQFVIVGAFISVVIELCGVSALSFAVGLYLPLSTTLPIFAGGLVRGAADIIAKKKGLEEEDADLGKGSLFSTGLVAGGALFGVVAAIITVFWPSVMDALNCQSGLINALGQGGYDLLGTAFYVLMSAVLLRIALKR
ncbi:MAG: OPT/YSL family transporter [Elusimicrobiales bacterium]|nr:OPT/YSL family transporter [Elusimicrobiales bacterium]